MHLPIITEKNVKLQITYSKTILTHHSILFQSQTVINSQSQLQNASHLQLASPNQQQQQQQQQHQHTTSVGQQILPEFTLPLNAITAISSHNPSKLETSELQMLVMTQSAKGQGSVTGSHTTAVTSGSDIGSSTNISIKQVTPSSCANDVSNRSGAGKMQLFLLNVICCFVSFLRRFEIT